MHAPQVSSSVSLSLEGDGWGNALIRSFRTFDIWHRHQHSTFLNEEYGFYSQMAQKTIGKKYPLEKEKVLCNQLLIISFLKQHQLI